jgi:hypothetical protein
MRNKILTIAAITAITSVIFIACSDSTANDKEKSIAMTNEEKVQRGSYLVNAMGCDDCHSPKRFTATGFELVPELRFSGFNSATGSPKTDSNVVKQGWVLFGPEFTTAVGPWGQSFAANLTSDSTGIGMWTEAQFIKALREGKYKGMDNTRPLLPPMPWFVYKNLNDDDLKSIFAFLKSTKPVKNVVPAPKSFNKL